MVGQLVPAGEFLFERRNLYFVLFITNRGNVFGQKKFKRFFGLVQLHPRLLFLTGSLGVEYVDSDGLAYHRLQGCREGNSESRSGRVATIQSKNLNILSTFFPEPLEGYLKIGDLTVSLDPL